MCHEIGAGAVEDITVLLVSWMKFDIITIFLPTPQIKQQYYAGLNNLLASGSIFIGEYQSRLSIISKK